MKEQDGKHRQRAEYYSELAAMDVQELFEYCEASLEGDRKRAERELLDVFAVLVKEYERLERNGATFSWGEHFMRGDSRD